MHVCDGQAGRGGSSGRATDRVVGLRVEGGWGWMVSGEGVGGGGQTERPGAGAKGGKVVMF